MKEFMKHNTPEQKRNCLQNFDLSEHRQILSDLAIHIYHQLITVMEKTLTPAIGISHISIIVTYCHMQIITVVNPDKCPKRLLCCLDLQCPVCWSTRVYRGFLA